MSKHIWRHPKYIFSSTVSVCPLLFSHMILSFCFPALCQLVIFQHGSTLTHSEKGGLLETHCSGWISTLFKCVMYTYALIRPTNYKCYKYVNSEKTNYPNDNLKCAYLSYHRKFSIKGYLIPAQYLQRNRLCLHQLWWAGSLGVHRHGLASLLLSFSIPFTLIDWVAKKFLNRLQTMCSDSCKTAQRANWFLFAELSNRTRMCSFVSHWIKLQTTLSNATEALPAKQEAM